MMLLDDFLRAIGMVIDQISKHGVAPDSPRDVYDTPEQCAYRGQLRKLAGLAEELERRIRANGTNMRAKALGPGVLEISSPDGLWLVHLALSAVPPKEKK